ncbi:MAG: aspartate-semialdehyde dehydrogenase [Bdellovibrionales bacterium GWA2_49_15]|nr:MAG: aspartate-semialdehyde dehydrogenase [Bdellovibrionales bacterium GWA2_49_15]HAZ14895.1 aspartate-semialdehyde dehydrogenase [Bdellovibrionales bacterium]
MQLKNIGIVGWRGMVGQVLMERMQAENDFSLGEFTLFSASATGRSVSGKMYGRDFGKILDASDLNALKKMDVILTCQGGDYTKQYYPMLKREGWRGFWIDAASALRMEKEATIILDPVNMHVIKSALQRGETTFVGGNCTVSLMLMAIQGLFKANLVEWISTMTYQAASGAGAKNMEELVAQYDCVGRGLQKNLNVAQSALELEKKVTGIIRSEELPHEHFGHPLAYSLLPWIDSEYEMGQSREEWKGFSETNKILQTTKPIPVDGTCVRVGVLRCHSQGLTIKLNQNLPLSEIEGMLREANPWVKLVPNKKDLTLAELTPAAISGTLTLGLGRVRKMRLGDSFLNAFTSGDQLLWGAAEPLRRMLRILFE